MSRLLAGVAGTVLLAGFAQAASLANITDARALADSTMALVVAEKIDDAFALLKPHWPLPGNEIDTLVLKTIQQRNVMEPRFGKSLGYVFVREDRIADVAVRYTYLEKRERTALRWRFDFYKPDNEWVLNTIKWDDNFIELFDH